MKLKLLKIFALVLYCSTPIVGDHIGGPFILFLILGLFAKPMAFAVILACLGIIGLIFSLIKPDLDRDVLMLPLSFIFMVIPVICRVIHWLNPLHYFNWYHERYFIAAFLIFIPGAYYISVLTFSSLTRTNKNLD